MRSTFHLLETSKRSLFAHQTSLSTTGHNIANANTAGYSRQVANLVHSRPIEVPGMQRSNTPGQLGTGVEVSYIRRIREGFLDDQFRNENKSYGSWSIQSDTLQKLETIMNEPTDSGIRTLMDNFWKSWSDLSKNPESKSGRVIVKENAIALADAFNATNIQLTALQNDLTDSIHIKADEINSITSSIANLNLQIRKVESLGDNANDLRDQRDNLTDELSKIVNIRSVEVDPDGYNIQMGGVILVEADTSLQVTGESLEQAHASGELTSGEVYGMIESRDRIVNAYIQELNTLADTIANGEIEVVIPAGSVLPGGGGVVTTDTTMKVLGINGLHKLGYASTSPLEVGSDFFTFNKGGVGASANIGFNPYLMANPDKIAASMRTMNGPGGEIVVNGNNTLALLMTQLKDTKFSFSGNSGGPGITGTIDDFFRAVVGKLGVETKEANRQVDNQMAILDQVDSRKQSVSGVSLDEEMSNLVKFQHAYSAAARVMTTFDEMLDKVINGMGIVGR
ncbi:flagellar hook protein FlgK [Paenibacillus swuensis]|uniref:Flagellar hook-associated protein 1 n=1 Tax=Paenibacillus swuensis TaxID=1178515 RepID=A0A172TI33_9BACL|nr:flagellar hook-associated protein FlgK [Paenibacillus swuensis]ANE46708.1 flagellar hook protein FlgK [Paenibacillus swuensis]